MIKQQSNSPIPHVVGLYVVKWFELTLRSSPGWMTAPRAPAMSGNPEYSEIAGIGADDACCVRLVVARNSKLSTARDDVVISDQIAFVANKEPGAT
jgi:hypothetical protein